MISARLTVHMYSNMNLLKIHVLKSAIFWFPPLSLRTKGNPIWQDFERSKGRVFCESCLLCHRKIGVSKKMRLPTKRYWSRWLKAHYWCCLGSSDLVCVVNMCTYDGMPIHWWSIFKSDLCVFFPSASLNVCQRIQSTSQHTEVGFQFQNIFGDESIVTVERHTLVR